MALSDLQVFSDWTYSTFTETLTQQIDLFNAASGGSLVLQSAANTGDYTETAFWKNMSGLVRRRDVYGNAAVTAITLEHLLDTSVKVASATPPVNIPPSQMTWIQRNPEEQGAVIGQQLAAAALADMLNMGITVTRTALAQTPEVNYDGTGDTVGTMNPKQLNKGSRLFGDQYRSIGVWVMHSTPLHDFYDNALGNAENLFKYETVAVTRDVMGRLFVVTDSPGLVTEGAVDNYHTLGLTAGAVLVEQNGDFDDNIETTNGKENIDRSYQAEWTQQVGVKGYAWDKITGGASPSDAALASAANWDQYSTSHKDLAGVVVTTL